jgi:hypothetical protein
LRFAAPDVVRDAMRGRALEHELNANFLCAVRRERIVTGITTGIIPAAATTGMLLGYGVRLGAPGRVFRVIGAIVFGVSAYRGSDVPLAPAVGLLVHIMAMLACGVAYASLTGEGRAHRGAWAIAIGAAATAIVFMFARTIGGSIALVLTPGNLISLGAVIALTLPIGMRFAPRRV